MNVMEHPEGRHEWGFLTLLAILAFGGGGACLGFVAGFALALAFVGNSGAAIAGGGDGVDALIGVSLFAGIVGTVPGALTGVWLGVRVTTPADQIAATGRPDV